MTTYLGVGAGGGLELLRLRLARRAAELLPDVDEDARVPVLELHERGLYADVRRFALLEESACDGDRLERLVARLRPYHLQRRAVDARARLRRHLQCGCERDGVLRRRQGAWLGALLRRRGGGGGRGGGRGREGGWCAGAVGTCIATSRGREEDPILVRLFPLSGGEGGRA